MRHAPAFMSVFMPVARRVWWGLVLSVLTLPSLVSADPRANVVMTVQDFLYQQSRELGDEVTITVYPPAASFDACPDPRPFLPRNTDLTYGRVSVGVRCGAEGHQMRYMRAEVEVIGTYLVAARTLETGERIVAEALEERRGSLSQLPRHALRERESALGMQARRTIRAGSVLQASFLQQSPWVERRQSVVVMASGAGFQVSREGQALDNGVKGERIRVRLPNRTIIEGVVSGPGQLRVAF